MGTTFKYFKTSPEIIRLTVVMSPLSEAVVMCWSVSAAIGAACDAEPEGLAALEVVREFVQ